MSKEGLDPWNFPLQVKGDEVQVQVKQSPAGLLQLFSFCVCICICICICIWNSICIYLYLEFRICFRICICRSARAGDQRGGLPLSFYWFPQLLNINILLNIHLKICLNTNIIPHLNPSLPSPLFFTSLSVISALSAFPFHGWKMWN